MHLEPANINTMSHRLWRQALSGDPEGALLVLEQMDHGELTIQTRDLLARLYIRAGRVVEAKMLWERILQADPHYAPAVMAMNKLNSPWLVRAVAKSYSRRFGVGVLLLLALYGLGMLIFGDQEASYAPMGMAIILAILGIYLAGLFVWAYITAESLFGFDRSISPSTISSIQYRELHTAYFRKDSPCHQG